MIKNKKLLTNLIVRSRAARRSLQKRLSKVSLPDYTTFTFFSIVIGAAAGLTSVLFHDAIEFFNNLFFKQTTSGFFFFGTAAVIVIPALGMLIQAWMILFKPDIAKKKGVSEIIKSVALRGGFISFRTTLFHFFAPVICIGSGGTVGPEGPAAQLGGGVASKLGRLFSLSDERRRIFTAAGAGAAIAAIFNTPLGGVFFALEIVLLNDFHSPTFSSLILASVTASAISRIFLGNESIFVFHTIGITNYSNLYIYILLGILAGFISLLFIRYSGYIHNLFVKKIYSSKFPQWLAMILVGLLVGVSGYFYKEIFGIGYKAINEILATNLSWQIVLTLFVLKFILVPLVIQSGGFGGTFAPSLFMGACIGYLFAFAGNSFWNLGLDPVTLILVGMGSMLGGINTIPISAILIIFEMTQNYSFILPLMLAVIISTMIVQVSLRGSVHVKHLEAEGFKIIEGRESNILKSIRVKDITLDKIDLIPEETPLPQVMGKLLDSQSNAFYTVNQSGSVSGIITETEMRPIMTEYELVKDVLVARDVANPQIITLSQDDDLDYVLNLFGKWNLDQFPVVDTNDNKIVLGSLSRQNVISVYNRESLKANLATGLAKELKTIDKSTPTAIAPGYSIIEYEVPNKFIGKTLSELKLRNTFGVEVLMIKQPAELYSETKKDPEISAPDPTTKLKRGEVLVVFGSNDKIDKFKMSVE